MTGKEGETRRSQDGTATYTYREGMWWIDTEPIANGNNGGGMGGGSGSGGHGATPGSGLDSDHGTLTGGGKGGRPLATPRCNQCTDQ